MDLPRHKGLFYLGREQTIPGTYIIMSKEIVGPVPSRSFSPLDLYSPRPVHWRLHSSIDIFLTSPSLTECRRNPSAPRCTIGNWRTPLMVFRPSPRVAPADFSCSNWLDTKMGPGQTVRLKDFPSVRVNQRGSLTTKDLLWGFAVTLRSIDVYATSQPCCTNGFLVGSTKTKRCLEHFL